MKSKYLLLCLFGILFVSSMMLTNSTNLDPVTETIGDVPALVKQMEASGTYAESIELVETTTGLSATGSFSLSSSHDWSRTMLVPMWDGYDDDFEDNCFSIYGPTGSTVYWQRGDNDYDRTIKLYVVEFTSDSGVTTYYPSRQDTDGTYSIGGTVTVSETFIINLGRYASTTTFGEADIAHVKIASTTQYEIIAAYAEYWAGQSVCIVEVDGASVYADYVNFATTDSSKTASIGGTVTIDRCLLIGQACDEDASDILVKTWADYGFNAYISSTTQITVSRNRAVRAYDFYFQVIEFPSGFLETQYVSKSWTSGTSTTVTISSVDTSNSFAYLSGSVAAVPFMGVSSSYTNDDTRYTFTTAEITASTTVTLEKSTSGATNAYYVCVVEFLSQNDAPTNDGIPSCSNLDDSQKLYAKAKDYQITVYTDDADGYSDIDYIYFEMLNDARSSTYWRVMYDEDANSVSEVADTSNYITLNLVTFSATRTGTTCDVTFYITFNWNHPDISNIDLRVRVYDTSGEFDDTYYENDGTYDWDVETRLDYQTAPNVYDSDGTEYRGNIGAYIDLVADGDIEYYGSASHVAPPSSAVDVWMSCSDVSDSPWHSYTLTAGYFAAPVSSDDVVGLDTYTFKIVAEGSGSGGTDLYYTTSITDTYIADRVQVSGYTVSDSHDDIHDYVSIDATLIYDYDNTAVTDGTVTINGYAATHQGSGVWRISRKSDSVTAVTYNTVAVGITNTHGITEIDQNSQSTTVIWDRIQVVGYSVSDARDDINDYVQVDVTLIYDYGDVELTTGTVTINGYAATHQGSGVWRVNLTSSSVTAITFDTVATGIDDTYEISEVDQNSQSTTVIWDRIQCTGISVSSSRLDIHDYVTIDFTLIYDYGDVELTTGTVTINGYAATHQGAGVWRINRTSDSVTAVIYNIFTSTGNTYGITEVDQNGQSETVIWDRIKVLTLGAVDTSLLSGETATIYCTLEYEYNHESIESGGGSFTLNGLPLSWNTTTSRWETTDTESSPTSNTYDTIVGTASLYGITELNMNSLDVTVTWSDDEIVITLSVNYGWTAVGYNVTISWSGIYSPSGDPFNGDITLDTEGSTLYPEYTTAGERQFTTISVSDPLYGISVFSSNTISVTWDTVDCSLIMYSWEMFDLIQVQMILETGAFAWNQNASNVGVGHSVNVYVNDTLQVDVSTDASSEIGTQRIGAFGQSWYFGHFVGNITITVGSRTFTVTWWDTTISIPVEHTIHLSDFDYQELLDYIYFHIASVWGNGTWSIWDNSSLMTYQESEGTYYLSKSSVVGLHNITILLNCTDPGGNQAQQTMDFSNSDYWLWLNVKYWIYHDVSIVDIFHTPDDSFLTTWNTITFYLQINTGYTPDTITIEAIVYPGGESANLQTMTLVEAGLYKYERTEMYEGEYVFKYYVQEGTKNATGFSSLRIETCYYAYSDAFYSIAVEYPYDGYTLFDNNVEDNKAYVLIWGYDFDTWHETVPYWWDITFVDTDQFGEGTQNVTLSGGFLWNLYGTWCVVYEMSNGFVNGLIQNDKAWFMDEVTLWFHNYGNGYNGEAYTYHEVECKVANQLSAGSSSWFPELEGNYVFPNGRILTAYDEQTSGEYNRFVSPDGLFFLDLDYWYIDTDGYDDSQGSAIYSGTVGGFPAQALLLFNVTPVIGSWLVGLDAWSYSMSAEWGSDDFKPVFPHIAFDVISDGEWISGAYGMMKYSIAYGQYQFYVALPNTDVDYWNEAHEVKLVQTWGFSMWYDNDDWNQMGAVERWTFVSIYGAEKGITIDTVPDITVSESFALVQDAGVSFSGDINTPCNLTVYENEIAVATLEISAVGSFSIYWDRAKGIGTQEATLYFYKTFSQYPYTYTENITVTYEKLDTWYDSGATLYYGLVEELPYDYYTFADNAISDSGLYFIVWGDDIDNTTELLPLILDSADGGFISLNGFYLVFYGTDILAYEISLNSFTFLSDEWCGESFVLYWNSRTVTGANGLTITTEFPYYDYYYTVQGIIVRDGTTFIDPNYSFGVEFSFYLLEEDENVIWFTIDYYTDFIFKTTYEYDQDQYNNVDTPFMAFNVLVDGEYLQTAYATLWAAYGLGVYWLVQVDFDNVNSEFWDEGHSLTFISNWGVLEHPSTNGRYGLVGQKSLNVYAFSGNIVVSDSIGIVQETGVSYQGSVNQACNLTVYEDGSSVATLEISEAGDFSIFWDRAIGTGNITATLYFYTSSETKNKTITYAKVSIYDKYDIANVNPYFPSGEGYELTRFQLWINGTRSRNRDWQFYNRTDYAYNIVVKDFFGAVIYNETHAWAKNIDILIQVYEFSVSHMLQATVVDFSMTGENGQSWSTIIHPNEVRRFYLYVVGTYSYQYSGIFNESADATPDYKTYYGSVTNLSADDGIVIVSWGIDKILSEIRLSESGGGMTYLEFQTYLDSSLSLFQEEKIKPAQDRQFIIQILTMVLVIGVIIFKNPTPPGEEPTEEEEEEGEGDSQGTDRKRPKTEQPSHLKPYSFKEGNKESSKGKRRKLDP